MHYIKYNVLMTSESPRPHNWLISGGLFLAAMGFFAVASSHIVFDNFAEAILPSVGMVAFLVAFVAYITSRDPKE